MVRYAACQPAGRRRWETGGAAQGASRPLPPGDEARHGLDCPPSLDAMRSRSGGSAGVDLLEAHRAQVPGRGVQPPSIVHLLTEARQPGDHVLERIVAAQVHLLVLERLREAFGFRVTVRVAAALS